MYGPEYERQLADIRRRGWRRAAVTVPFLAAAIVSIAFTGLALGWRASK